MKGPKTLRDVNDKFRVNRPYILFLLIYYNMKNTIFNFDKLYTLLYVKKNYEFIMLILFL
jgi:hypothetical protein